jgi:hypothetical protein
MEQPSTHPSPESPPGPCPDPRLTVLPGARWSDGRWLLLLLLLTLASRVWQLTHTEVPSRDSVGYIRIAWRLGHEDWRQVLPSVPQHPGYPFAILALSAPARALFPHDLPLAMQMAAQLASALASLLLVIPIFYLGKELFDGRVGFWAAIFLQALPATGKLMADGLSEPVFLLFATTGLVCACRGLRTGNLGWFVAAGLAGGLAYLTRVEGALVVLATGFVLVAAQLVQSWRRSGLALTRCGLALGLPALVVALPYVLVIGNLTVKPIKEHMIQQSHPQWGPEEARGPHGLATTAIPWAIWLENPNPAPRERILWALEALALTLFKATFYVLWAPALLGLFVFRDHWWRGPGNAVVLLVVAVLLGLLYRVAQVMGYLSERHTSLVLLVGLYFAVVGVAWLVGLAAAILPRTRRWAPALCAVCLGVLALTPLGKTLAILHADRSGFKQAGLWLAGHAEPDADLVDPYAWAGYYAGRTFQEGASGTPIAPSIVYVVLEEGGPSRHDHLWWLLPQARALAGQGKQVATFAVHRGRGTAEVVIYRVCRGPGV